MEASVNNNADGGAEAQGPSVDLSPLMDRVGELANSFQGVTQRLDQFEQRLPQNEPEPEPDPFDGWDPNDLLDVAGGVDPAAAQQRLQDLVQQGVQSQLAQVVEPLQQRLTELQTSWDAASLQQKYPDLTNPEVAEQTVTRASEFAQQIAKTPEEARELVRTPGFIELVYQASQAGERAAGEVPAAGGVAEFEAGGGASPGGGDSSIAQEIVNARQGNSFWT